eukprot:CAMPEP_0170584954 /NCGR_PEP_ID=MMETSP0224-20130122/8950_1 /TAXON_ID=285029 /ORGANISM="Togula jolla, Strain CCCM 725" /LENGTH=45 /DNA_ID= /DNA_START= /DNA_END= /DNA_ORIENTATION=
MQPWLIIIMEPSSCKPCDSSPGMCTSPAAGGSGTSAIGAGLMGAE